jgi:hypothetical protein
MQVPDLIPVVSLEGIAMRLGVNTALIEDAWLSGLLPEPEFSTKDGPRWRTSEAETWLKDVGLSIRLTLPQIGKRTTTRELARHPVRSRAAGR